MKETKDTKKLKELENKVEELTNNWKRALADYSNLEKRLVTQRQEIHFHKLSGVLNMILPILDNLKKSSLSIKDPGLDMVVKQFSDTLKNLGIEEYGEVGDIFDPLLHEVVAVEEGEGEKKKIVEVYASGYKQSDRVIRPASVKVGK